MEFNNQTLIATGLDVIETEAQAVSLLAHRIDHTFAAACRIIIACKGRLILLGMGKSGHIGRKIAATFASTGTPAQFVHPAEASHGDLGMITQQDVMIAISNSGETTEILNILPLTKRLSVPLITLTGNPDSQMAQLADININISVPKEACSLGLAPTASTTATLAMGDALAVAVLQAKGFTANDFAFSHPGGKLGRKLLVRIADIMQTGDAIPRVFSDQCLSDAMIEMTQKCLGMTTIVSRDAPDQIIGIFTDGDLRRTLDKKGIDIHATPISEVMTLNPITCHETLLASEAVRLMEKYNTFCMPVIRGPNNTLVGALNMHNLFKAGVL